MPRITLKQTLVAVLAASTLAATPALARPVDGVDRYEAYTSSLAGTTEHQDLRGEHARDAARAAEQPQDLRGEHAQDAARFNGRQMPATLKPVHVSPKSVPATTPADDDDLWLILGIGLAASGVVAAGAVAVTRKTRRVPA